MKLWNRKARHEIERELEQLRFNSSCYSVSIIMLYLYADVLRCENEDSRIFIDDEHLIRSEKKQKLVMRLVNL